MKAVQLNEYGPSENLKIVDVSIPEPSEDEVLIKVQASSVIFADILTRKGDYPALPASLPFIPGREVAGVVDRVGANVTSIKPGMRVMGQMHTGGYAEYAKASIDQTVVLPERVSYLQGLVYFVNLRVAYMVYNVFGKVRPEDTILVHAASGGIGSLLMHIAKRWKNNNVIIALSSSDEKLKYCRANGADHLINYKTTDYVEEVLRVTDGKGVDVSLNSVGGLTLEKDPYAIKPTGRWAIYGHAAGKGLIDPYKHLLRSLTINVSSIYTYIFREEFQQATAFLENWLQTEPLMSVTKTFRIEDVQAAHRWLEGQHSVGKLALVMED